MAGIFKDVNLEEEIRREKKSRLRKGEDDLMREIRQLLIEDEIAEDGIIKRIFSKTKNGNPFHSLMELDPNRIYHIEDVKQICIKYRLRFLEANRFKGEIPKEAILEIKKLEEQFDNTFDDYKIIAPAELFRLDEKDKDPLLFLSLGNNYYYLIHKWGGELNGLRRVLSYPMQSFDKMVKTIFLFTLTVTVLLPHNLLVPDPAQSDLGIRVIFFFWLLIATAAMSTFFIMSSGGNFNENVWNSKYRA